MFTKIIYRIVKASCFLCIVPICCAFDPVDIVFKNINLMPDPIDKTDRYPHLPKTYTDGKTENIGVKFKFPSIKSEKIATPIISVRKIIDNTVRLQSIEKQLTPTLDGIDYMFNLTNIGLTNKESKKQNSLTFKPSYLEKETTTIPILNDLPGMSKIYNKKTPIVKNIKDIQVPGLDDVLPTKVGAPLTPKDYDIQPHLDFFNDYTTPDDVLNTSILDVIP